MEECQTNPCSAPASFQPSSCQPKPCHGSGCEMTDEMMELADEAWSCLMKEKMKAYLEKMDGKKMDTIAQAAVEVSKAHWGGKMKMKADMREAMEKLRMAMSK
ncbi:MAG: hypothetical protein V1728_00570 [Candidatus Micrarchaeota archaeon]